MNWNHESHLWRASGNSDAIAGVTYNADVSERTHYRKGVWYADVRLYIYGNRQVLTATNSECGSCDTAQAWCEGMLAELERLAHQIVVAREEQ